MASLAPVVISLIVTTCPPASDICTVSEHSRYFGGCSSAQTFCEDTRMKLAQAAPSSKSERVRSMVFHCMVTPESARRGQLSADVPRAELGIGPARSQ